MTRTTRNSAERFRREGLIALGLDHPAIVRALGGGAHEGQPYLVYELVPGAHTLGQVFANTDLRRRVELVHEAALALAHAHERGVIHRDVKLENVLVDLAGRARVTDFGLAEPLNPESSEVDESVNGTLRYMAPERFQGICDETSDVYSLGITLFELVTQQSAFETESRVGLINAITQGNIRQPAELSRDIPPDLAAVISKAISQEPDNRYQSAGEFASDLLRYINGERVIARTRGGILRWLWKTGR